VTVEVKPKGETQMVCLMPIGFHDKRNPAKFWIDPTSEKEFGVP
jgi:hypothetical protein